MRLENPPSFKTLDEARDFLKSLTSRDEVTNFAYLGVSLPGDSANTPLDVTTYSSEWARHYFKKRYHRIDPAIIQGLSGILPFDWNSQPYTTRRLKEFFSIAREFGVSQQGVSFPIRGAHGERALLSVNSSLTSKDWEFFKANHLGDLALFAYMFHLKILEVQGISQIAPSVALSEREKSVIKWAAEGKTAWETAKILGITENTANFYLRNAAVKLSATTKPQAVANAIRIGFLS
ncbi:LuxR family transcriptional regulator [Halomonas stenophila]|uniref:DNA-binding CsgD family transcriptional regulator n=1 Tax=Halomonas stenophila TaxID=795312 RepID=A0A7W5HN30_9GAMM|nr:LuxR family transcriptional regulator [Halomonas stenophila]MBB3233143.1 DNA-binding CsgD family transcriptional regulator [Halomonas stenophila]